MVKIDPNKPLPDHTKLDYDECCAKLILEELFPLRYKNLMIKDKPDLQGENIGVEVTFAGDQNRQEAMKLWYTMPYVDENVKVRNVERMAQLGVQYTGGIQVWPVRTPEFGPIKKAIEKKLSKATTGAYMAFLHNELFVFTDLWMTDYIISETKEFLFNKNGNSFFETVYIFSQGTELFKFSILNSTLQYWELDSEEQTKRNVRARKMVEEGECE